MKELIILSSDEVNSAWAMYNAFKNGYGIFLDVIEGVAFFDTTTIHEFAKNFEGNDRIICKLHKLDVFADGCDKIKAGRLLNNC